MSVKLPKVLTITKDGWTVVNPANVKVMDKYNVRDPFDVALNKRDASLVASMNANGYQLDKPITVRIVGQDVYVVAGHRRLQAALLAGVAAMSVIPEALNAAGEMRSEAEMLLDLYTSNDGEPLAEHEKGQAFARMEAAGMTIKEIAAKCGISTVAWVKKLIEAAKAEPEIKALLKNGWTAPTTLVLLTGAHGKTKAAKVVKRAARTAKAAGRSKIDNKLDLEPAEQAETGTTKVSRKGKAAAPVVKIVSVETETVPVHVVPEAAPHVVPVVAGVSQGGPFHLGTGGGANCDLFDVNKVAVGTFYDVKTAKQILALINMGWDIIKPKAGTVASDKPEAAPVKAVPAAPVVPVLSKAEEKKAAKARLLEAAARAEREAARAARTAEKIARHEAEQEAARLANVARAEAAKAEAASLSTVIAAKAIKAGTKRGQLAQAMVAATTPRKSRGH